MEVLFFGSLQDITGVPKLSLSDIRDTDSLVSHLDTQFPALRQARYFIAVNRQMIDGNTMIALGDTIALMPPFSGG